MVNWLEVPRIHATPIATQVIEFRSIGDRPHEQRVRRTMRSDEALAMHPYNALPVALVADTPRPFPTVIRLVGERRQASREAHLSHDGIYNPATRISIIEAP